MASIIGTLAPVRKAVGGAVVAALTAAYTAVSADNFDFSHMTESQWKSVVLFTLAGFCAVYFPKNKGGKAADKPSASASAGDVAGPTVDASDAAPAAPPAIAEDVLSAIAADWAAATAPAETPAVEAPVSPSV